MIGLTAPQLELYRFIERHVAEHGTAPTFAEMRDGMGIRSKSSIARMVEGLEERGAIVRAPRRARAIQIVRDTCPKCGASLGGANA